MHSYGTSAQAAEPSCFQSLVAECLMVKCVGLAWVLLPMHGPRKQLTGDGTKNSGYPTIAQKHMNGAVSWM